MSTTVLAAPRRVPRAGLPRLTLIELRKMLDTRAGFWLLAAVIALTVADVVVTVVSGTPADHRLSHVLDNAVQPSSVLLPVVGILLVTSEWTQRTALITFALVPDRRRVMAAKLAAAVGLGIAALVVCLVLAVLGTAVAAPGVDGTWSLPLGQLVQVAVYVVTAMVMGVGFGALLLASAPAIVVNFLVPIAWAALEHLPAMQEPGRWLNPSNTLAPLTDHLMSSTEWARAVATLALLMVLPLVVGLWRVRRAEIQ
jgi:ABC-2 type transport system permease protein